MQRIAIASTFALGAFAYAQIPTALLGSMDLSTSRFSPPLVAAAAAFLFALPIRKITAFAGTLVALWAFVAALLYLAATATAQAKAGMGQTVLVRFAWLFAGGAPTFGWPGCLLGAMIGGVCQRVVRA
jgi:hypothetical protein